MSDHIITDARGVPIPRPERCDFESTIDFIRAVHAYNDRLNAIANAAFAAESRTWSTR